MSSLPGTLNFRMKFCHSTGIARSGGGVRASTTQQPMLSEDSDPANPPYQPFELNLFKEKISTLGQMIFLIVAYMDVQLT